MFQRKVRKVRPGENGTTAIEFAIVGPVLLLLLGALAETGAFILIQTQLQFATEEAARQIRTLRVGPTTTAAGQSNQKTASEFKQLICSKFSVTNCSSTIKIDVQSDTTFNALAPRVPTSLQSVGPKSPGSGYSEAYTPGRPGDTGSLVVTYDWNFVFPPLGILFGNVATYPRIRRLTAISVFRNEM